MRGIVRALLPHFGQIIVTEYLENPRAVPTAILGDMVRQERRESKQGPADLIIREQPSPQDAWWQALERATTDELICVTGSFFIAAELRSALIADAASAGAMSDDTSEPDRGPCSS